MKHYKASIFMLFLIALSVDAAWRAPDSFMAQNATGLIGVAAFLGLVFALMGRAEQKAAKARERLSAQEVAAGQ